MNIQLDNEDENSSKTAEYFLPAGLTDEDSESDSEVTGGVSVEQQQQQQQSYSFEDSIQRNEHVSKKSNYNVKSESPRQEPSPGSSLSSSVGRTVVNTPVTGGLFHRTLSSYHSEALNSSLLENSDWRHEFSNTRSSPLSANEQYYPQTCEGLSTTAPPSVAIGSAPIDVGFPNQSSPGFYGRSSLTEPPFAPVQHVPYVNSFVPSSYSSQGPVQPSDSVIGSAFLIPDDSSTSSFTSFVDASVFPFTGERELSSSQHSSGWSRRSSSMKKLCRYFPNCPHGDSCKFYHPSDVHPAFAMTAEANMNQPGRPRTGSWGGLWSSNAAMEWMHAVIQRHNFFNFAHRNKHSSQAVVTNDPVIYGDRIEDTSRKHRSTIGSIFHPGFIVGNRHRNVAKNETSSKKAEKQNKKNAKKNSKKDKSSSSSLGKENSSASQPNSRKLSSSENQTCPSGNTLSDNSNSLSTNSGAPSGGTMEDVNEQPRKLTRAEKRRLRAIRFYENKRRVAEEAKQKQRMMEEQTASDPKANEKAYQEENFAANGIVDSGEQQMERKDRDGSEAAAIVSPVHFNSLDRSEQDENDIFYDAPLADLDLLESIGFKEKTLQNKDNQVVEQQSVSKLDIATHDEAATSDFGTKNESYPSVHVFSGEDLLKTTGKRRESSEERLSYKESCIEQHDHLGSVYRESSGDMHRIDNFIWNVLSSIFRLESFSSLLCFLVLYMFPVFSTLFTFLLPRPLSVNSLWFLLLMIHFWSWQHAENRWKRVFSRYLIPLHFLVFGFSHLTVIDQLTSMERILLAFLLCIVRSGDILTREVLLVLCIQYIFLEWIQSQPLWLQVVHFIGASGYVNYLHRLKLSSKWKRGGEKKNRVESWAYLGLPKSFHKT